MQRGRENGGPRDELVKATAFGGAVRALAVDATGVVAELSRRQVTAPAVTAALGRAATGALMLGAMLKEEDQLLTLRIQGGGPAGTLLVSATGGGEVRGLVGNPWPDIEQVKDGKLNVSGAVGRDGNLTVTRDLGLRQPYSSTVALQSGEVGEDLAYFLAHSEQLPSAVGIGVFVGPDGGVVAAGGYLVQLLPGLAEEDAAAIEAKVSELPHPTVMLRGGETPDDILRRIFPDGFEALERRPVRFHCPCSRERAERALILLGPRELTEIRADDEERGHTELVCEFCGEDYRFDLFEIEELIRLADG